MYLYILIIHSCVNVHMVNFIYNYVCLFCYVVKNVKLEEDHHYAAVGAALSQLHQLCNKICSKSITLRSLSIIEQKQTQFKKLCDTVSSSNKDMCMTYSQLEPCLVECFNLQSQFVVYQDQISTLLEFCNNISYGTDEVYSYFM